MFPPSNKRGSPFAAFLSHYTADNSQLTAQVAYTLVDLAGVKVIQLTNIKRTVFVEGRGSTPAKKIAGP